MMRAFSTRTTGVLSRLRSGPTASNLLGAGALQVSLLVSGTLAARALGPEDRGYLALFVAFASTVCQLGTLGISLAVTYLLASGAAEPRTLIAHLRRPVLLQCLLLVGVDAAIVVVYVIAEGGHLLWPGVISVGFVLTTLATDYAAALALGARRHPLASSIRAASAGTYAVALSVLYLTGAATLTGIIAVAVVSMAIASAGATRAALRAHGLSLGMALRERSESPPPAGHPSRVEILRLGRASYGGYLAPIDAFRVDQFVVGLVLSPAALGVYVVGAAFTNLSRAVATNLGMSSTSEVAGTHDRQERSRKARRTLLISGTIITTINGVVFLVVGAAIPFIFGPGYEDSVGIARILCVAGWSTAMKRIVVDVMRGYGVVSIGTRSELVNAIVFAPTAVVLGLTYGPSGVAAALAISSSMALAHLASRLVAARGRADPARA